MCKIRQEHWPNVKFHPLLLSEPPQFVRISTFQGVRGIPQSSWPTSPMLQTEVSYWLVAELYFENPCSNVSHKYSLGLRSADLAVQFSEPRTHHVHRTVPGQAHLRGVSRDVVVQIKGEYLEITIFIKTNNPILHFFIPLYKLLTANCFLMILQVNMSVSKRCTLCIYGFAFMLSCRLHDVAQFLQLLSCILSLSVTPESCLCAKQR